MNKKRTNRAIEYLWMLSNYHLSNFGKNHLLLSMDIKSTYNNQIINDEKKNPDKPLSDFIKEWVNEENSVELIEISSHRPTTKSTEYQDSEKKSDI